VRVAKWVIMPQSTADRPGAFDQVSSGQLLFVYGTLRRGGRNDIAQFGTRARWHSRARVRGHLHDLGPYPGLVLGGTQWVTGELYWIDPAIEPALDRLEGVWPDRSGEYQRKRAWVVAEPSGEEQASCSALLYEMQARVARRWPLIASGDWMAHLSTRQGPAR
jgi:gamma-glutamylcyclotransferase (GGCT)/AIG2-like uncharacterized protein YtfP